MNELKHFFELFKKSNYAFMWLFIIHSIINEFIISLFMIPKNVFKSLPMTPECMKPCCCMFCL